MKYCYSCGRITTGDALFCNICGKTYDTRLCPRMHPNPRAAQRCSQCGSSELSTPQPKVPFWLKPFLLLLTVLPGFILLVLTCAFLVVFLYELAVNPHMQLRLMLLGLVLALTWYAYLQLPTFIRSSMQKHLFRKKDGGHH
jgi:hypothetical protein